MTNIFKVSQSKVKTARKCRRAYWNKYVEHLRRKRIGRPFAFGRIVHEVLEEYANGEEPAAVLARIEKAQGKMFKEEIEEYGDILDDARVIITDYLDYYPDTSLVPVRLKGKSSEYTFEIDIGHGLIFVGKIDKIGKTPNKLRWLVEHKTGRTAPSEDHRWRNVQSALYLWTVDALELDPVEGTCWDFIKSKPPSVPKILKSGEVSTRELDTLPTKISEWLHEQGLDPAQYSKLLGDAKTNRSNYFTRVFTPVKPKVVKAIFDDFIVTATELKTVHGMKNYREMTIDRHCDWCDYESLCRAELLGGDVNFVKKREYVIDEKPEETEPDFEV